LSYPAIFYRKEFIFEIFRDKQFLSRLFDVALPITLQNFISASLNLVGGVMVGQLGEAAVAAVGLSNQVFFLLTLLLFGVNSGSAIFIAQFWGRRDLANIRRALGLALGLSLLGSALFAGAAVLFPETVLRVYSKDAEVIALGSEYLRIFGLSFLFTAVTYSFAFAHRSTGDAKTPLLVTMSALSFNALLSYALIFGKLGLPALGVKGAALAVLIARVLECIALVLLTYHRKAPPAASLREMTDIDRPFTHKVLSQVLPVTFNEIIWSFGITTYNIIYARIGTESIAAMNIAVTIDNLAMVFFIGIGNACAILVGHWIGADDERKAYLYAARSLVLGFAGAFLVGGLILLTAGPFLTFYKVSPTVIEYTRNILLVVAALIWLRVSNLILFIGILRSGGDTRFAFILDCGAIWLIGVPLAFLGAFVLHLPVYLVYLLVMTEELFKWVMAIQRFFTRRWINNLAKTI
jgi:putative MATE family efflux protein